MDRERLLNRVLKEVYTTLFPYAIQFSHYDGEQPFSTIQTLSFKSVNIGDSWGSLFDRAWFKLSLNEILQQHHKDLSLVLMIDIGGEGLVYDASGHCVMGITNKLSSYGIPPDKPGKWIVPITHEQAHVLYIDASCNDLFGYVQNGGLIQHAELGYVHPRWHKIYYDLEVLIDWESGVSETGNHQPSRTNELKYFVNPKVSPILNTIEAYIFENQIYDIDVIDRMLNAFFDIPTDHQSLGIFATGHAHLDIAWMWPIDEGRRKAKRTFATALSLMDRYPEYIFGASQYQLFDWIKKDDPTLFSRIQQKVNERRFELQGVFWVECDLNIPSMESLIRQIYYGKQFTKSHFDQELNFVWEPDVFGFSGALPQILVKSGVRFICSQKLSQNKMNPFPHHSFKWEGIDGSVVMVHHFPEETYDSRMRPASVLKLYHQYKEKEKIPNALMVFGIGDGGGGPGEEHLERYKRIHNVQGLPKIDMRRVSQFLEIWSIDESKMETIHGELYFERHQGTYTTEVLNKIGNETMERLLNQYEQLLGWLWYYYDVNIDSFYLDQTWKEVLLYQFHDILPGSSIIPVYLHSRGRYQAMISDLKQRIIPYVHMFSNQLSSIGFWVFNPTGWVKRDWIKLQDQWFYYDVAPYTWQPLLTKTYTMKSEQEFILNNGLVQVIVNKSGWIDSLIILDTNDELIDKNRVQSMWTIYHELANEYAAWDFADNYRQGQKGYPTLSSIRKIIDGPKQIIEMKYRYMSSLIALEISLLDDSPLVSMSCEIQWREINTSVKFNIPITVNASYATCHMQYGNIERPTHNDDSFAIAKDEIYAHQFVDVSNEHVGIALIAPQKYGYRVKDQSLEVSILRSQKKNGSELGIVEDPDYLELHYGDLVDHSFSLGLFPHKSKDLLLVEQYADQMKNDVWITKNKETGSLGTKPIFEVSSTNVSIQSMKLSFDHKGLILRIVEHSGINTLFDLSTSLDIPHIWLCDMQEVLIEEISLQDIPIKGYEVLTIKLLKE